MGAKQPIVDWNPLASVSSKRQRLVYSLAMTLLVVAASSATLRAQDHQRRIAPMPPDLSAPAYPAVLTPQYVPPGYSFNGEYRGEPDGSRTGEAEIKLAYMSIKVNQRHIFGPLFIFISPMTDNFFGGTQDAKPEVVELRIGDMTVEARYFDGAWWRAPNGKTILPNGTRVTWNTSNLNSLVFPLDGFMIGIRGSKQAGVGRAELIKVAESLTYTAR